MDDFAFVDIFDKFAAGTLQLGDLTRFHNEHRYFFAFILMLVLGSFTAYSILAQVYVCWLLKLCCLLLFYASLRRVFATSRALLLLLPVSASIFSLRDYESFTFGVLMGSALTLLWVTACFLALSKWNSKGTVKDLAIAMVMALLASFSSFAGGLMTWPVGFVVLASKFRLQQSQQQNGIALRSSTFIFLPWCVCAIASVLIFVGTGMSFAPSAKVQFMKLLVEEPHFILHFFLRVLGSAAAPQLPDVAGFAILALIFFSSFCALRALFSRKTMWITEGQESLFFFGLSFLLFGLLNACAITYGRAIFPNLDLATAPRYVVWTSLSLVGAYLIAISLTASIGWVKNLLLYGSATMITLGFLTGIDNGLSGGRQLQEISKHNAYVLSTYKQQDQQSLSKLYPHYKTVEAGAKVLEKHHWNVFSHTTADIDTLPKTAMPQAFRITTSTLAGSEKSRLKLNRSKLPEWVVSGWVYDTATGRPSSRILLRIGKEHLIPGACGTASPELANYLHRDKLANSGFVISFATRILQPGKHALSLVIVDSSGTRVFETPVFGELTVE